MFEDKAFKFCPRCGGGLVKQSRFFLSCSKCGFHLYINPHLCNGAIIENRQGEVLLVRRRIAPKKDYWDVVGGFVSPEETLEESMRREMEEELGAEPLSLTYFRSYNDIYLYRKVYYYTIGAIFVATVDTDSLTPQDDISEIRFFPPSEIPFHRIAFAGVKQALQEYLATRLDK